MEDSKNLNRKNQRTNKKVKLKKFQINALVLSVACLYVAGTYNACGSAVNFDTVEKVTVKSIEQVDAPVFKINNGDAFTNDNNNVLLTMAANNNASEMLISYDQQCLGDNWESFIGSKVLPLVIEGADPELNFNKKVSVYVKYKSADGVESSCVEQSITHDNIPPTLNFSVQQDAWINTAQHKVPFVAADDLSGVKATLCRRETSANFATCSNEFQAIGLNEGSHKVIVSAEDAAGNVFTDELRWAVDMTAPVVVVNKQPSALTNSKAADIQFVSTDSASQVEKNECKIGAGAWADCANILLLANLAEGAHKVLIRATDFAGNVSFNKDVSWLIDLTAPTVTFLATPTPITKNNTANFQFSGKDGNVVLNKFECRLDANPFAACTSPVNLNNLTAGNHSFEVLVIDLAGNKSVPAKYQWMIDQTKPTLTEVTAPQPLEKVNTANFQLIANDVGSGVDRIECRLNMNPFANCTFPKALANLGEGPQAFQAIAYDKAGNPSDLYQKNWVVDTLVPTVEIITKPLLVSQSTSATFGFTAADLGSGIDRTECKLDNGVFAACSSPKLYENLANGAHTFYVQAYDKAGNLSVPAFYTWTVQVIPVIQVVKIVEEPSKQKADILFLIDPSGSMNYEQARLGDRFGTLISTLGLLDWQIAVSSMDTVANNGPGSDGNLVPFEIPGLDPFPLFITPEIPNSLPFFQAALQKPNTFMYTAETERGIANAVRLINKKAEHNFFRDDSYLHVIMVSDEDEFSGELNSDGTRKFPLQAEDLPQTLIDKVNNDLNVKGFIGHSIITIPGDTACAQGKGTSHFGVVYQELSQLTGGVVGSVCADDYSAQLAAIGNVVLAETRNMDLPCKPLGGVIESVAFDPILAVQPTYTIQEKKLVFDQAIPPLTKITVSLKCEPVVL